MISINAALIHLQLPFCLKAVLHIRTSQKLDKLITMHDSHTATMESGCFCLNRLESQSCTLDMVPIITVIALYPVNHLMIVVRVNAVHRSTCIVHEVILLLAGLRIPGFWRLSCCLLLPWCQAGFSWSFNGFWQWNNKVNSYCSYLSV